MDKGNSQINNLNYDQIVAENLELKQINLTLNESISALTGEIELLKSRISDLESMLGLNSSNSSKPPSTDTFVKPKSQRKPTGKKPGGQRKHKGHHLEKVDNPDNIIKHFPDVCECCNRKLNQENARIAGSRQVFDLPVTSIEVTEHRIMEIKCKCGKLNIPLYPSDVKSETSYGSNIRSCVAYLSTYQHLPVMRIKELLNDLFKVEISTGSIENIILESVDLLTDFNETIKEALINSDLIHADETGLKINAKGIWAHVISNETLTMYHLDEKRGSEAIDNFGIIPNTNAISVHDGFISYKRYENITHSLCNAHHLRELTFIDEQLGQKWAKSMARLLRSTHKLVEESKNKGCDNLTLNELQNLKRNYKRFLNQGFKINPKEDQNTKRGRTKQSKAYNLLKRLQIYESDVLRFATDFNVPFDNNQAERDLRMVKLKQKVSGGFRSEKGAIAFLALRGYISTAKKNHQNIMDVLKRLYSNDAWLPELGLGT